MELRTNIFFSSVLIVFGFHILENMRVHILQCIFCRLVAPLSLSHTHFTIANSSSSSRIRLRIMDLDQRLQVAAQMADQDADEPLPDAHQVASRCSSWGITAQLKPHQADGVAWLIRRYVRGVNVILGDEMGLGKTLQSITVISYLKSERCCPGPFLVLCPLSVADGWASEFSHFAPNLQVMMYIGDKIQREGNRKLICEHVNQQQARFRDDPTLPFDVLLTTYELAMVDVAFLSHFRWRFTIIDEAQRLKNSASVLYRTLEEHFMMPRRLLLTGTPIQNNLSELWALLHFCMPLVFNDMEGFLRTFQPAPEANHNAGGLNDEANTKLKLLRSILRVFMLRRTKDLLFQSKTLALPPLSEVTIMTRLVQLQKMVYISVLKRELPKLVAAKSETSPPISLQNIVVQLRKACSHPYLFDGVEPEPFQEGEHLVQASGKLMVLDALLKKLQEEGHRVLVFAQMTRSLDILQDYLEFRRYSYERLDGSVRAEERFAAVRSFNTSFETDETRRKAESEEPFVFLLTTRAGGLGLNLVGADTVIFFEQDWNPQADKQALQRAHRIGQVRPVLVVNIVTENTVEEVILHRAKKKLKLTHDVIGCDDIDLEMHGPGSATIPDLQSMIIFGLHKLDISDEYSERNISYEKDLIASNNEMVKEALEQRGKNDITARKDGIGILEEDLEDSIYRYEGQDFSVRKRKDSDRTDMSEPADQAALNSLIAKMDENSELVNLNSIRRRKRSIESISEKKLEELQAEKQRKSDERKKAKWESLGYKSLAVCDPGDTGRDLSLEIKAADVHFVFGDCTKPIKNLPKEAVIILRSTTLNRNDDSTTIEPSDCADVPLHLLWITVDDSGVWGSGGMFHALAHLSEKVCDAYVAAHEARDLHLGDLHLIQLSSDMEGPAESLERQLPEDSQEGPLWVGLAVVQSYDHRRKISRSDISLDALETCLRKIAISAAARSASIHMPRIGSHPKQDRKEWYAVERLLRKYASFYCVQIFVYYFKRPTGS